jgi:hypothetical protein
MAVKRLPLPDELRKFKTWGELEAATKEDQSAWYTALLNYWQANHHYQRQLDFEADQRAFERGYVEEPGPINEAGQYATSGTNRTANP